MLEKEDIKKKALGKLFVISGPSGSGKTTLARSVVGKMQEEYNIYKVITYTSRMPRAGEISGIDYNFITKKDFGEKAEHGFFLEITIYDDETYGSPHSIISEAQEGKSFIIVLDKAGAMNVKEIHQNIVLIWLSIPNIKILKSRLKKRGTESYEEIRSRLEIAEKELVCELVDETFDYCIINENLEECTKEICQIIRQEMSKCSSIE
jgi:guanylate kinase